ncbi:cytosolic endo-beta-N-acetylglucosaminidase-like [Dermacentor silvarum]|uniref:cytosolic endo-beta-N-acetylglucosaminidase-like n=1 Tax=Dermacentor silvarum TaxID=543639 RepID=UPI0021013CEF|nr:cytosolic endo-beta-N-acetylglucosaminidase-like [Dermacentor silvarum]
MERVSDREVAPLRAIVELLSYKALAQPLLCAVEPLSGAVKRGKPGDPRTIFCHDMGGGYKEDRRIRLASLCTLSANCRFIHGCDARHVYRFHHWQIIDTFIYYSHHLVTIPPPGWISAAHKHGVKVLGTFSLDKDRVSAISVVTNFGPAAASLVASQLAHLASVGRFDGWLISIGCKVDRSRVPSLKILLKAITTEVHKAVPGSLVIWYDAVDVDGKAEPHNELNEKNSCFLDLCDGIFLNFRWTEAMLQKSAQLAGDRKADVYAGVDVYARDTPYPGGFEMYKAVQLARKCGLSAAVFAAGWVYETKEKMKFGKNQYRLWKFPDDCCSEWRLTKPPLSTSFCQGFGSKAFEAGKAGHLHLTPVSRDQPQ